MITVKEEVAVRRWVDSSACSVEIKCKTVKLKMAIVLNLTIDLTENCQITHKLQCLAGNPK